MERLLWNIYHILGYAPADSLWEALRLEGTNIIRDVGQWAGQLKSKQLKTLHDQLAILAPKNGSSTLMERVQMRCIGALGLVYQEYGLRYPEEIDDIVHWLYFVATSPVNQTALLVSRRAGHIIDGDRIIKS